MSSFFKRSGPPGTGVAPPNGRTRFIARRSPKANGPICAAADDGARPFFLRDVRATGIDACGENGEYHSFAFAGPFFTRSLAWNAGERRDDGRFAQLGVNVGALLSR